MNEFHGWLVVREKYDGYCTDTIKLMSVVREIEKRIDPFLSPCIPTIEE